MNKGTLIFFGLLLLAYTHDSIFSMQATKQPEFQEVKKQELASCAICLCDFEPQDSIKKLAVCHHAFHTECIDQWFKQKPNCPNCRKDDAEGKKIKEQEQKKIASFTTAIDTKNLPLLRTLLTAHPDLANLIINSLENRTILHSATQRDSQEVVFTLLEYKANPKIQDCYGRTPVHIAAEYGLLGVIHALCSTNKHDVNIPDNNGDTALHIASKKDFAQGVYALLRYGANPKLQNGLDQTPFHLAALGGFSRAIHALCKANDYNPDLRDNTGHTALHHACRLGWTRTALELLSGGADTEIKNSYGQTALHCALHNCRYNVVDILIRYKANIMAYDNFYRTPCDYARNRHIRSLQAAITSLPRRS